MPCQCALGLNAEEQIFFSYIIFGVNVIGLLWF